MNTIGEEHGFVTWRKFGGHWESSAAKARLSAYVLWRMSSSPNLIEIANECNHARNDAGVSVLDAFRRESAIAIELILKAVLAHKLRSRDADPSTEEIPATHDIPRLWQKAELPKPSKEDLLRLHQMKYTLLWSGRYPSPKTDQAWEDERKELMALENEISSNTFKTPVTIGWEDFDRLYQIANNTIYSS